MEKPEALFLADELEAPLGTVIGAELYRRAAKELRRLHAELERCKQVCAATAEGWRVERDALLEALEYHVAPPSASTWRTTAAITALRAALAQQVEPKGGGRLPPPLQAEPVAWRCACGANLYIGADGAPSSVLRQRLGGR
jgi:hypothetical protein